MVCFCVIPPRFQTAKASKYFECIVAQLWNLLNPLRVQHKLSANFNPAVRKVDSIEGSDESANDLLWITRSYRKLVDELQFRLSSKSCKIAVSRSILCFSIISLAEFRGTPYWLDFFSILPNG